MNPEKFQSLDEKVYQLSCELMEASYTEIDHKQVMRQVAKKLQSLAREIVIDHYTAMQESSLG